MALIFLITHICPACGKRWECACSEEVKEQHVIECGGHFREIACSLDCAERLQALLTFLERMKP
jgi:hypothetical protein